MRQQIEECVRLYQYCRSNIVENWGKIGPMRKKEKNEGRNINWYYRGGGIREEIGRNELITT